MAACRECHWKLKEENQYESSRKSHDNICKRCRSMAAYEYRKQYYINNKDRLSVKNLMYRLKQQAKLDEVI